MIPNIKLIAGMAAGALLAVIASYHAGKWQGASQERVSAEISATRKAAERIKQMETNNAKFRDMSQRDLCRALADDSGLQPSACD